MVDFSKVLAYPCIDTFKYDIRSICNQIELKYSLLALFSVSRLNRDLTSFSIKSDSLTCSEHAQSPYYHKVYLNVN